MKLLRNVSGRRFSIDPVLPIGLGRGDIVSPNGLNADLFLETAPRSLLNQRLINLGGLAFDGTGGLSGGVDLTPLNKFTVCGWVKYDAGSIGSDKALWAQFRSTGNQRSYLLRKFTDDKLDLIISDDGINSELVEFANFTFAADTWYFIAMVLDYDEGVAKVSVNGSAFEEQAVTNTSTHSASVDSFTLGYYDSVAVTRELDGTMDGLYIYNRALSLAEVGALFNEVPAMWGDGNAYVEVGDFSQFDAAGKTIRITGKFLQNSPPSSDQAIVAKRDSSTLGYLFFVDTNGYLNIQLRRTSTGNYFQAEYQVNLSDGIEHDIDLEWDTAAATATLDVDGSPVSLTITTAKTGTYGDGTTPLAFYAERLDTTPQIQLKNGYFKDIEFYSDGILVGKWAGDGREDANWADTSGEGNDGTVTNQPIAYGEGVTYEDLSAAQKTNLLHWFDMNERDQDGSGNINMVLNSHNVTPTHLLTGDDSTFDSGVGTWTEEPSSSFTSISSESNGAAGNCLRVTAGPSLAASYAGQVVDTTEGNAYRIKGYLRSDGTRAARLSIRATSFGGSVIELVDVGTTTEWTPFEVVVRASTSVIALLAIMDPATSAGDYIEMDAITVEDLGNTHLANIGGVTEAVGIVPGAPEEGEAVYRWEDLSRNKNHPTQDTAANMPGYGVDVDGIGGVRGNAVDQFFNLTKDIALTGEWLVLAVVDEHFAGHLIVGDNNSRIFYSSGSLFVTNDGNADAGAAIAIPAGRSMLSIRHGSDDKYYFSINNGAETEGGLTSSGAVTLTKILAKRGAGTGIAYGNGPVYSIVVIPRGVTVAQRAHLYRMLKVRYETV